MAELTVPIELDHEYLDKLIKDVVKDLTAQFLHKADVDSMREEMLHEIYMAGTNMAGEYKGCWVRFKDIEKIVNEHFKAALETKESEDT